MTVSGGARETTVIVLVLGPTGVGKTRLGVRLARLLGGEVISADAMQVYRGFDAATAKPTIEERRACPHALVDTVDPREDFNLGSFVRAADGEIARIAASGRCPVVVGGTGLYLRGLLKGVFRGPERDPELRRGLLDRDRTGPPGLLHRALRRVDPEAARRIPPADRQRIVRALEVARLTGRPLSQQQARGWSRPDRYPAVKIGLLMRREDLYRRIDQRVEGFFRAGLVDEVRGLLAAGVPREANAFKGLGYRQVLLHLDGTLSLEETVGLVQRESRRYAKRQITWFRREADVTWFDVGDPDYPAGAERHAVAARAALMAGSLAEDGV